MKPGQKPKKCFDDCDADSFKVKKLPENFADTVLNLELDIENADVPLEAVNQLIELYACAVEYYESIHSDRFLIFQNKMRNLLMKPNVMGVMERSSPSLKKSESQTPELIKIQKLKEHEMNFLLVKQQVDTQKVQSILKDETKKLETINTLLKTESHKQQDDIMKRLMERKNKKITTKSQKDDMIDNIVNIVKKNESSNTLGRRASRSFDTNVLEREYYGTEDKDKTSPTSPNMTEQRKKSIAMLKRASKDLTAFVEKRMSKLNVMEIEQAVQLNRVNSIKKHMIKPTNATVVEEETKNSAKESSDSDDDEESSCMEMSNTDISMQSPNNNTKGQGLIKLKPGAGMKSSLKKKDKKEHSIKSTTFHTEAGEQTGNPEETKTKNKTSADEILENKEKEAQDQKNAEEPLKTNESESQKTIETPVEENKNNGKTENLENLKKEEEKTKAADQKEEKSKIPEEYLKEKEEAMKKFSDKINMLEGQINSSGGQSKLFQKMLDQVKKDQELEIEKLNKKYNIETVIIEKPKSTKEEAPPQKESLQNNNNNNSNDNNETAKTTKKETLETEPEEEKKEKKGGDPEEEARIKKLEKEKDDKIKSVLSKFGNQISQLETQLKQNKSGGGLIAKLLEKLKKEELNQMEAINKDYDEKLNLKS